MEKAAFITGTGGYIDGETALTLSKNGIKIAVCDINQDAVQKTVDRIISSGGVAKGYVADVTDSKSIADAINSGAKELGRLDIMIHVAGGSARVSLTKALAKELGPYKINVNSVAPGIVMRPDEKGGDERALKTNLLGEKCLASDVANLVEFLVSDKAKFITGQTYVCDGGRGLSMMGSD